MSSIDFKPQKQNKIICVGRNYIDHAKELNNPVPKEPLLFIKPWSTITPLSGEVHIPSNKGEVHHELEIALVVDRTLTNASKSEARESICGIGLALDLTLRDVQTTLKEKGQPWEKAKSFDNACPVECIEINHKDIDFDKLTLQLNINGSLRQLGHSIDVVFDSISLIQYISTWFTLNPGDIVLTGTPAGVGKIENADEIESTLTMNNTTLLNINSYIVSDS